MVVLSTAVYQTHLWNHKKSRNSVAPLTESEFWEAGSGQECFCILLKITKLCCADELACDFQLHYEETGHYVSSL